MMVFFADGDWSVAPPPGVAAELSDWSGIAHACGWFKKRHYTRPAQIRAQVHPICAKCGEQIPDALVGLWKMHNWDNIQQYESEIEKYRHSYTQYFYNGKPLFYLQPGHNANVRLYSVAS